jgi:hypothetical protein
MALDPVVITTYEAGGGLRIQDRGAALFAPPTHYSHLSILKVMQAN